MTGQGLNLFSQVTCPGLRARSPTVLATWVVGAPLLQSPSFIHPDLAIALTAGALTPENSVAETGWQKAWEDF